MFKEIDKVDTISKCPILPESSMNIHSSPFLFSLNHVALMWLCIFTGRQFPFKLRGTGGGIGGHYMDGAAFINDKGQRPPQKLNGASSIEVCKIIGRYEQGSLFSMHKLKSLQIHKPKGKMC